jgi:hypothetical protein
MKIRKQSEYNKFSDTINELLKVSHADIDAKLQEEKQAKKRKKSKKSSASREASGRT